MKKQADPIVVQDKSMTTASLSELIMSARSWFIYLKSKWLILLIVTVLGIVAGITYCLTATRMYIAKATFVLDESGQDNGLGALSGGLSMLGVSAPGDANLFAGDNLVWLYTSDKMIGETLMQHMDSASKSKLLLLRLLEIDDDLQKTEKKIKESDAKYKPVTNTIAQENLSISQRKLLNAGISIIRKNYLTVKTEDKTTGIISVTFTSKSESFSQQFTKELVERVNTFYYNTKIKKAAEQVAILQKKVDEVNAAMNNSMTAAAVATDNIPFPNPSMQTLKVKPQRQVVDVQVNSSIYTVMVQQLEAAKITLAKEAPLIQMIDDPKLPLATSKPNLIIYSILGASLAFFMTSLVLIAKKYYNTVLQESTIKNEK